MIKVKIKIGDHVPEQTIWINPKSVESISGDILYMSGTENDYRLASLEEAERVAKEVGRLNYPWRTHGE